MKIVSGVLLKVVGILTLLTVSVCTAVSAQTAGLVTVKSNRSVKATAEVLEKALQEKGLTHFTTFDHAANAQKAGLDLASTLVVVFGNPKLGTPLMQSQRSLAIDLPQKMLIWQDSQGQVWIGYNDPAYLARRHNLPGQDKILQKIADALAGLAETAAK